VDILTGTSPPSHSPLRDLASLLRRIFWLVHTVKTWPTQPDLPNHSPTVILAAAPFNEWNQLPRQIQSHIRPETWNIERKPNNGQAARTVISLRKDEQNYEVEILALRGFKPARFYYDYNRGWYLDLLTKSPIASKLLHIAPTGLYYQSKLVITNPADLKKFFGLAMIPLDSGCTRAELYSEIVRSPFFDPNLAFPPGQEFEKPATADSKHSQNPLHRIESGNLEAEMIVALDDFKAWWNANSRAQGTTNGSSTQITKADIEDRIHYINLGLEGTTLS